MSKLYRLIVTTENGTAIKCNNFLTYLCQTLEAWTNRLTWTSIPETPTAIDEVSSGKRGSLGNFVEFVSKQCIYKAMKWNILKHKTV
jgi:hypothetical protein